MLKLNEPTPLYKQLSDLLRQQIVDEKLKPDHRIPSERALCQKYKISRITVRQAVSDMINEGLLYRRQGKGTFVAKKKINQGLVRFVNFGRTVLELGMKPSTKILSNEVLPADVQTAKILDIPLTSQILKLSFLGMGNGEPLVLYESYFPLSLGRKVAKEAHEMERKALPFSTLDLYGKTGLAAPKFVIQTFEATRADGWLVPMMKVKKGAAIFMITSIFQTGDQRPLEFRTALYRGDRYKFHMTREFS